MTLSFTYVNLSLPYNSWTLYTIHYDGSLTNLTKKKTRRSRLQLDVKGVFSQNNVSFSCFRVFLYMLNVNSFL